MKKQLKQLRELKRLSKKPGEIRLAAESWDSDFQILIATILSARTRDEITIPIAEKLFLIYPRPKELSKARLKNIEKIIRPVNFYKNKSKNIIKCSKEIISKHKGVVPHRFEDLILLPGVGRKTANVFLSEVGYETIGVDTHISYISNKLGWTKNKKQEKIEKDLQNIFPYKYWGSLNPILVKFGKTHTSRKQKDLLLGKIKRIK